MNSNRLTLVPVENELGDTFPTQYTSDDASFSGLFDFQAVINKAKASVQTTIDTTKATVSEQIGTKYTDQLGDMLEKQKDVLVQKGTDIVMAKATDVMNTKENQDAAISGGINAAAQNISNTLINVKDTFRVSGIKGLYTKYPVPFYAIGGLTALLLTRFVLGGKKYTVRANPRKKSKKRSKKK